MIEYRAAIEAEKLTIGSFTSLNTTAGTIDIVVVGLAGGVSS